MVERSPELKAVMRRHLKGVESRDVDTVKALIEVSDHTLVIGSDPMEWYMGPEAAELLAIATKHKRDYTYEVKRLEAFEEGTIGWAAADTLIHFEPGPNGVDLGSEPVPLRMTAVFVLDHGTWRIIQWHASVPSPDDPDVVGAELSEAVSEMIMSLADESQVDALTSKLQTNTVSILFTDIVDSTVLARDVGDIAWSAIITEHLRKIDEISVRMDGVVVKTTGDGAMLAFGSARNAVRAALELLEASRRTDGRSRLTLRVGVHTGEAVKTDLDYFGQTVNTTARIMASAEPDQVLVSNVTRHLIGEVEGVEFDPPLAVELKGIPGTQELHPVKSAG